MVKVKVTFLWFEVENCIILAPWGVGGGLWGVRGGGRVGGIVPYQVPTTNYTIKTMFGMSE